MSGLVKRYVEETGKAPAITIDRWLSAKNETRSIYVAALRFQDADKRIRCCVMTKTDDVKVEATADAASFAEAFELAVQKLVETFKAAPSK